MKFLVDESSGLAITKYLKDSGYDVLAVSEVMPQAEDKVILSRAVKEQRVIVTNDKDFGELIFRDKTSHSGVLLFRLQDEHAKNRVLILKEVLKSHKKHLENNFCVATEREFRVRPFDV